MCGGKCTSKATRFFMWIYLPAKNYPKSFKIRGKETIWKVHTKWPNLNLAKFWTWDENDNINFLCLIYVSIKEHDKKWNNRNWFRTPPMSARRYMEENDSAAMLAAKRPVGFVPEVNLRKCVTHMPLPSMNKAAHYGFETQRRCLLIISTKQEYQGPHKKDLRPPKEFV